MTSISCRKAWRGLEANDSEPLDSRVVGGGACITMEGGPAVGRYVERRGRATGGGLHHLLIISVSERA